MFKKIIKSFPYAIHGIGYSIKTQVNFRFHVMAAFLALVLSYCLNVSTVEFLFVLNAIFMVITAELVNTAVEKTVDLCTSEICSLAQVAKNVAAGAVLTSAIFSVVTALIIFVPKLVMLWR
ncbi:diacylglycerol kinase family protein [Candidatus Contubernalis alkaliaceticus]|uniref:diacylglycerol kinase family protein n=1 Tax=Candidatus Contubernalis alkaliaceticus TaxID=338645 RepID=UPI001F4BD0FE|nr:diacylglycerol kinase family protein [Candidatus Contubernalis alkalaceticus]UNC93127.1 diacylglycerol kinase family protein [Candidatus Contubernalis alkalaceticus]